LMTAGEDLLAILKLPFNACVVPDMRFVCMCAAITEAVERERPKMVFLTSPNNPDGSMIAEEDLLAILKLPVLVVLDEAYIEFSEEPSRLRWVLDHPNLVIFRTFSKSAGLAGLRVGYGRLLFVIITWAPEGSTFALILLFRLALQH